MFGSGEIWTGCALSCENVRWQLEFAAAQTRWVLGEVGEDALDERLFGTMVAEGDVVMVHWTAQASHLGQWHGLEATGARVSWSGVTIAHLVDGKIVRHHTVWDALALLEQIGAVPRIRKAGGSRL